MSDGPAASSGPSLHMTTSIIGVPYAMVIAAIAFVLAMIPLTRSVFWGPMAVAIMGGLVVATVLTLLALPAMYAAWFRVEKPSKIAG